MIFRILHNLGAGSTGGSVGRSMNRGARVWSWVLGWVWIAALGFGCWPALAHKPSDGYLTLTLGDRSLSGQLDLALRDLEELFELDANGDGKVTWGELRARHPALGRYLIERIELSAEGKPLPLRVTEHLVSEHTDGAYAAIRFTADYEQAPKDFRVQYRVLFDVDSMHRGLLNLVRGELSQTGIFSPTATILTFNSIPRSRWTQFLEFVHQGAVHIWKGPDHILFLVSLLLPSVLIYLKKGEKAGWEISPDVVMELPSDKKAIRNRAAVLGDRSGWTPIPFFKPVFWNVVGFVTAFTLAHSITLSAAALNYIRLPSRWVESGIALSVAVAAANNFRPFLRKRIWLVVFLFGLVHGLGLASVLSDLGLPKSGLLWSLLGFNVGVEFGQLSIVLATLPVAFSLRRTRFYRWCLLYGGSFAVLALAIAWLIDRVGQYGFMPF